MSKDIRHSAVVVAAAREHARTMGGGCSGIAKSKDGIQRCDEDNQCLCVRDVLLDAATDKRDNA